MTFRGVWDFTSSSRTDRASQLNGRILAFIFPSAYIHEDTLSQNSSAFNEKTIQRILLHFVLPVLTFPYATATCKFRPIIVLEMPQNWHQFCPGFKRLRKMQKRLLASSRPSVSPPVCLSVNACVQTDRRRRWNFLSYSRNSPHFIQSVVSLPRSQETRESTLRSPILFP